MRKLALFDIDKTLFNGYVVFPLIEKQHKEGTLDNISYDHIQKYYQQYKSGTLDYETHAKLVLIEWSTGLKGIPYSVVLKQTKELLSNLQDQFFSFVPSLLSLMRNTHDYYFVTGEPDFVAEVVNINLKGNGYVATVFDQSNGKFTGTVNTFLASRDEKKIAVDHIKKGYPYEGSFAFGDSDGDIAMLSSVERPICINPSHELRSVAQDESWGITTPDTILGTVSEYLR